MSNIFVFAVGFLAQGFFSARMLVQWIMSERARKSLSPDIYWILSLAGSILLFVYGWLRNDFSIIFGQIISYYVYIWNLNIKGVWKRIPLPLRWAVLCLPCCAFVMIFIVWAAFENSFFHSAGVPLWLIVFGSCGQFIFTVRFVYQWYYSYCRHRSVLLAGFWIISLAGSVIIVVYACFRLDPVLILGQSVGFVTYSRNIALCINSSKK